MTNASGLRSLAAVFEQDEAVPYKMIREADPDGLVIALLRASADELDANTLQESKRLAERGNSPGIGGIPNNQSNYDRDSKVGD